MRMGGVSTLRTAGGENSTSQLAIPSSCARVSEETSVSTASHLARSSSATYRAERGTRVSRPTFSVLRAGTLHGIGTITVMRSMERASPVCVPALLSVGPCVHLSWS